MRCEDSPQRGQLAVGAVEWAVIVRTLSLLVTAVISHPGKDKAEVSSITAQPRIKGNMINGLWQYPSEKSPLPEHESCGRTRILVHSLGYNAHHVRASDRGEDQMKKSAFTNEQILYALRQVEAGTPVAEICRKLGISEQTFYRWKRKFAGMGVAELRRLRQLEEENRKLKQLVADLTLDKHMLQEALRTNR
jgi:putative transposase